MQINILRKIKSMYGKMYGLSWCSHCGLAWNVVKGKYIPYNAKLPGDRWNEMFPICEDCFEKLSPEQILSYCKDLVDQWKKFTPDKDVDMEIIEHNIKYMKENNL